MGKKVTKITKIEYRCIKLIFCCLLLASQVKAQSDFCSSSDFCTHVSGSRVPPFQANSDSRQYVNFLDIHFRNVNVDEDGQYLYFDIFLAAKDVWCPANMGPNEFILFNEKKKLPAAIENVLLVFDFDENVMAKGGGEDFKVDSTAIVTTPSSWGPPVDEFVYPDIFNRVMCNTSVSVASIALTQEQDKYCIEVGAPKFYFRIRWKIKEKATGFTGITARSTDFVGGQASSGFSKYTTADPYPGGNATPDFASTTTEIGMCFSGDLDVSVGAAVTPTLAVTSGSASVCPGEGPITYGGTATDLGSNTLEWVVKDPSGIVVTSMSSTSITTSASFTWGESLSAGIYNVCMQAIGASNEVVKEACYDVTVKPKPTLTIAGLSSGCASTSVALAVSDASGPFKWYKEPSTTPIAGANVANYSPELPSNGSSVTYKVEATGSNGCKGSGTKTITIKPAPDATIGVLVANGSGGRNPNIYGVGDQIKFSATEKTGNTYKWTVVSQPGTVTEPGTELEKDFYILSGTQNSYTATLKVDNGGCSSTKNVTLTKNNGCGITSLTLAKEGDPSGNEICVDGVGRLVATAVSACAGDQILEYQWFKGDDLVATYATDNASADYNPTANIFMAHGPDEYKVLVRTLAGNLTQKITLTGTTTPSDKVVTPDEFLVKRNKSTYLTAEAMEPNGAFLSWEWQQKDNINGDNLQQYILTKNIPSDTRFIVYAVATNGCRTMDTTWVRISNEAVTVEIDPPSKVICKGGGVTLTAEVRGGNGNETYVWTNDKYTVAGTSTSKATKFKHAGAIGMTGVGDHIRYVTVKNTAGQVVGITRATVTVEDATEPVLTIEGSDKLCEGTEAGSTLTVLPSGLKDYKWFVRDENGAITTLSATEYVFNKRGEYKVWVEASPAGGATCKSDTAMTVKDVVVNGFDFALNLSEASNYKLGSKITATATATANSDATVNLSSGYNYTWAVLQDGAPVSDLNKNPNIYEVVGASEQNGYTFSVQAIDGNGCKNIRNESLSLIQGGLELIVDNKTVHQCSGGATLFAATVDGGVGNYNILWYDATNPNTPLQERILTQSASGSVTDEFVKEVAEGTKIVVKVTDETVPLQLMRLDTITVGAPSLELAPVISAGANVMIAKGTSTILFGGVDAGSSIPATWQWNPKDKLLDGEDIKQYAKTINLEETTVYQVSATGTNGCESKPKNVTVTVQPNIGDELNLEINNAGVLCKGNVVKLGATWQPSTESITHWEWVDASGQLVDKDKAIPTFTASEGGTHEIFLKVTYGTGLTATASRVLTVVNSLAPKLQIEGLDNNNHICSGGTLEVSSSNGVALSAANTKWYLATGNTIEQEVPGLSMTVKTDEQISKNVWVKVRAAAGCPADDSLKMTIIINPLPEMEWGTFSNFVSGIPVTVNAKISKGTVGHYEFIWKHENSTLGKIFESVQSSDPLETIKKTENVDEASAYHFNVFVKDGRACFSDSLALDTILTLDKNNLRINVSGAYGNDEFCKSSSTQWGFALKAEVLQPDPNLTYIYTWTKGDVGQGTGRELFIKDPIAGAVYIVTVTVEGDVGKTGSAAFTLKVAANETPIITLSAIEQTIPPNTKTVLYVKNTPAPRLNNWKWSPEAKIADGESTLATPYTTLLLDARTEYTVYAATDEGCVTQSIPVVVKTLAAQESTGDDKVLFAKIIPPIETICLGNKLTLKTVVWSAHDKALYKWLPADNLVLNGNGSSVVFTSTTTGIYTYIVEVKSGGHQSYAKAVITVKDGIVPILGFDRPLVECAGGSIGVSVANPPATVDEYIWYVQSGTGAMVENPDYKGSTYTWPSVADETSYTVKVIGISQENCRSEEIETTVLVQPAAPLDGLVCSDSCGQVIIYAENQPNADYTWSIISDNAALFKSVASVVKDTVRLELNTPPQADAPASLEYTVEVIVKAAGGGSNSCDAKGKITGKLFFKPEVELDTWTYELKELPYIMDEKGAAVTINVKESGYDGIINSNVVWDAVVKGSLPALSGHTLLRDLQKDDTVIIVVSNKEDETCYATDSIPVYLYPEAPNLRIDTIDGSLVHASLRLQPRGNYTIHSRKWDPYNMNSALTGGVDGYVVDGTVTEDTIWKETGMDTLEFYYATASRMINGKEWKGSATSDTVGYYLQDINLNDDVSIASTNYIPVFFDFKAMGCDSTRQFAQRIIEEQKNIEQVSMSRHAYVSQSTVASICNVFNFAGVSQVRISNVYALNDTTVLLVTIGRRRGIDKEENESQFMQYGKLPKRKIKVKNKNSIGNINWAYILPQNSDKLNMKVLFNSDDPTNIFLKIQQLSRLVFETGGTRGTINTYISMMGIEKYMLGGSMEYVKPLQVVLLNPQIDKSIRQDIIILK